MTILFIVGCILLFSYSILMGYYSYGWQIMKTFKTDGSPIPSTTVSVVIPFRNEEQHLTNLLQSLSNQYYPMHLVEFILVNDHSSDNSISIIQPHLSSSIRLIELSEHVGPLQNAFKKKAIEVGIQQSKGKLIVTTDADCTMGPQWISTIVDYYEKHQSACIIMPVKMHAAPSLLGIFQSLDFMMLQGITASSAALSFHGMCNGANFAYEKQAFEKVDGFNNINHISSGDDLLLLHKFAKLFPNRISYLKSLSVIVSTTGTSSWYQFFQQRIRWASKADQYQDKKMLPTLLLVYLLNFSFLLLMAFIFLSPFLNGISSTQWKLNAGILLAGLLWKTFAELWLLLPFARFYNQQKGLWIFPFLQPLHILYMVIAGWLGKFGTYQWKDRKLS
jgi:cellulose synthase/poly-beta-1,6-N-acetylglucosamine synthase-like glycosyltransferase